MPLKRTVTTVTLPLVAWAALMLTVSSIPGNQLPQPAFFGWDKLAHAAEYAVLAALLWRHARIHWPGERRRWMTAALAAGALFAMFDELHQIPIPCRTCSGFDLLSDGAGLIAGVMLMRYRSVPL